MSQISVDAITDASGGTTASINGYTPSGSNMVGRNRIINGSMMIDQRNAGASVTPTNGQFSVDRWKSRLSVTSKYSVQQSSTAPTGFNNSLLITSLSAYTVGASELFVQEQVIEGFNVSDLGWGTANAKTVTLSFWVRSSLTGTFGGSFSNSARNRSYPFSYAINSADTWEQKTITVAGDTTGTWLTDSGKGIEVCFSLGSGATYSGTAGSWAGADYRSATGATSVVGTSGATFYLTGVQLEVGSSASEFEHRQYGQELALCQRYYWKSDYVSDSLGIAGYNSAGNGSWMNYSHVVQMRTAPTMAINGTWAVGNAAQPTIRAASATHWVLQAVPSSTAAFATYVNSSDDYVTASAEL